MDKIRVLVVDDSPFSQKTITTSLTQAGFEICACAGTGREAIDFFREKKPDLVTMDYTLPDMDGLTCSREIMTIDPATRIVILSAMKDKALIMRGTVIGIRGFLQKPINYHELYETLRRVCHADQELHNWRGKYLQSFITSFENNLKNMVNMSAELTTDDDGGPKFTSRGVAVIFGITGTRQGRIILDMSPKTLMDFIKAMLNTASLSDDDMLHGIAEFANIVAGHALSQINNAYKDTEMRLTAPSILLGDAMSIINPKLVSCTVTAKTDAGEVYMSIGFAGGQ